MVGSGGIFDKCKKLVKDLNLDKNVIFTGNADFEDVPKYVNAADICVALFDRNYKIFKKMSYFYSPIKINEYKACGKVILASDIGNLKRYINNKINGFLVNEQDAEEIARVTLNLVKNRRLIKIIGANNLKDAGRNYTWDKINEKILKNLK